MHTGEHFFIFIIYIKEKRIVSHIRIKVSLSKNKYFKSLFIHLLRNFMLHLLMQVHMLVFSLSKAIQNTRIKFIYDFSTAVMYVLKHSEFTKGRVKNI